MQKKKILFIIDSFCIGGAEKSLTSLLSLIDYEKYDVFVQTFKSGGAFECYLDKSVHLLPLPRFTKFCTLPVSKQLLSFNLSYLFIRLKLAFSLRKNALNNNRINNAQVYWQTCKKAFDELPGEYDLAIGWGQGLPVKFVANKVKAKKKAAWINTDYEAAGHTREEDIDNFAKIDYIVSVSDKQNENMIALFLEYKEKCRTIYDINNAKLIEKMADDEKVLNDYDGLKIVTVGRLNQLKGQDMAIDAAKLLKDKGIEFRWYAVGDGPARPQLEKQIKELRMEDDFVLLGAKVNPYPYMKACDIYVQTSRFEGFCLTLTEARIFNKLCVTTEFDCVYNQMIQEKNGLVVDMNAEAIAAGVERMINDTELRNQITEYLKTEKKGNAEEIAKIYELI